MYFSIKDVRLIQNVNNYPKLYFLFKKVLFLMLILKTHLQLWFSFYSKIYSINLNANMLYFQLNANSWRTSSGVELTNFYSTLELVGMCMCREFLKIRKNVPVAVFVKKKLIKIRDTYIEQVIKKLLIICCWLLLL